MLKGICLKCGKVYYGQALQNLEQQRCDVCGSRLYVYDESLEKTEAGRARIKEGMRKLLHSRDEQKDS